MKPFMLTALLTVALVSAASAQTDSLPMESRAELQMQQTDRAMRAEERHQQQSGQTQFDINQLRMQDRPEFRIGRGMR
jgi:TolA-binding protein